MWQILASLLNQNQAQEGQREAQNAAAQQAKRQDILANRQRTNLEIQNIANQKQQGATNPILDDIMKKYGAGRYSS